VDGQTILDFRFGCQVTMIVEIDSGA